MERITLMRKRGLKRSSPPCRHERVVKKRPNFDGAVNYLTEDPVEFSCEEDIELRGGNPRRNSCCEAQTLWELNLEAIRRNEPRFFSTADARLSRTSETWKKGLTYSGLDANIDNCLALRRLYDIYFKAKERYKILDKEEFRRLSNTVSQFLRLCVARGVCSKQKGYKVNSLHLGSISLSVVQRFIDFHVACRSSRTVERKARHLKKICMVPFDLKGSGIGGTNGQVLQYLDVILNSCRGKAGHVSAQTPPSMPVNLVKRCFRVALADLKDMIASYKSKKKTEGLFPRHEVSSFVAKWSRVFTAFIVLCAGGQTPQAISDIEIPSEEKFEEILGRAGSTGYVELDTLRGKRTMALGLPKVALPTLSIPFLRFQVYAIHPIISSLHVTKVDKRSKHLLLDNETGTVTDSSKISREFKSFVCSISPKTDGVNPRGLTRRCMDLFVHGFRGNRILERRTEGQFLDSVARHLNTSAMHVRKCVGVKGSVDYKATAKELTRCLI